jgi:16S rRNA (adenine1518-N6/adenine1519-N6)-dimethyltransferase
MVRLGQHFLVNRNVAEKIARGFFPVEGPVLEIGPGKGILTELLIKYRRGNTIIAVELDNTLFYKIKNTYAGTEDFRVLNRDILKIDLDSLFPGDTQQVNIIGNVPYYISKELMDWVIKCQRKIRQGMFMVQKEFAEKLMATGRTARTGAQSILLNWLFRMHKQFDVQPGSFAPQPRVKSTVFLFQPRSNARSSDIDVDAFYRFLRGCFKNRRKTLLNNLSAFAAAERLWEIFEACGINPRVRAEQLTVEEFSEIYRHLLQEGTRFYK